MKNDVTNIVKEKYGETAQSGLSSEDTSIQAVAQAFGYSAEELQSIPAQANMGLSCGNPTAMASLQPGEVVVDLGSGGGLDVFLAANSVGPCGRAIGIDMTPEMIELANKNAEKGPGGKPFENVEFKLAQIDDLPLPDNSADVVISNCVINLAPDKAAVFREIFRVLKPGGRVAVSDIALKKELPDELRTNMAALVGCIAGAILSEDYKQTMINSGFQGVTIVDSGADLTAYAAVEGQSTCCSPTEEDLSKEQGSSCCCSKPAKPMHQELGSLFEKYDVNAYAASVKVFAIKPQED